MHVVGRVAPLGHTRTTASQTVSQALGRAPGRVILNIGGTLFLTTWSSLKKIPGTLLSQLSEDHDSYDPENGEYYFDRNPDLFNFILDAYRVGRIHIPHQFCGSYIIEELDFWGIHEDFLARCCWRCLQTLKYEEKNLDTVACLLEENPAQKKYDMKCVQQSKWKQLQCRVFWFLEDPTSSLGAQVCFMFALSNTCKNKTAIF